MAQKISFVQIIDVHLLQIFNRGKR